jgi:hypothetical protein
MALGQLLALIVFLVVSRTFVRIAAFPVIRLAICLLQICYTPVRSVVKPLIDRDLSPKSVQSIIGALDIFLDID